MPSSTTRFLLLIALVAMLAAAAHAQTFDFEGETSTSTITTYLAPPGTQPGGYTFLNTTSGGMTLTLVRQDVTPFDILAPTGVNPPGQPAGWGQRSLDPFLNPGPDTGFIGTLSAAVAGVSVEFIRPDASVGSVTLSGFSGTNGTGTLLATTSVAFGAGSPPTFFLAAISAAGINSFTLSSTSDNAGKQNGTFYDNINVSAVSVPEAGTTALLIAAMLPVLVTILYHRRKKLQTVAV